jgi:rSAM-associated Gly-rich repeat protein
MAEWNRVFKALSVVLPVGAFGASVLLALVASEASAAPNSNLQTKAPAASEQSVSARLQIIRDGVSEMAGSASFDPNGDAKATPAWWGNGGWGRWHAGWGNGGWRNGGWGNGGWGNGGWHNGWHNFWHNW